MQGLILKGISGFYAVKAADAVYAVSYTHLDVYKRQELESLKKECAEWIEQEEDVLSYAQFPKVALDFFKKRRDAKYGIDGKHGDAEKQIHPV